MGYALAARDFEKAADLIERYGPRRLTESDPSVFQMADRLPPAMLIARPKIGLYQAWFLIIQGHIVKALPLLHDMERQLAGADPNSGQQWMQTIVALGLVMLSRPGSTPEFDPLPDYLILEEIPAEELILRNAADYSIRDSPVSARANEARGGGGGQLHREGEGEATPWGAGYPHCGSVPDPYLLDTR